MLFIKMKLSAYQIQKNRQFCLIDLRCHFIDRTESDVIRSCLFSSVKMSHLQRPGVCGMTSVSEEWARSRG